MGMVQVVLTSSGGKIFLKNNLEVSGKEIK